MIGNKESNENEQTSVILFKPKDGIGALKKFVQACNKNNSEHNEANVYLESDGTVDDVIAMLKNVDKKNQDDVALIFNAMQILIVKVAAKYEYLVNNTEKACRFFIKEYISLVHSMLSSNSNAKQRRVVLKLLSAIVYLSIPLSREILNHLSLHPQMVATLIKQTNPGDPNSVRTSYIHFVLAFLLQDNLHLTKAFLDKHGALSSIFPGLIYDSCELVQMVLLAIKQHILQRQGISKTLKLFVFNNRAIESLINLYNWKGPNNCPYVKGKQISGIVLPEEKEIVIKTLHDFLLTLLTSRKHGIIFQENVPDSSSTKSNNQIVNVLLQKLECPWEHEKPAELIIEILKACPGLMKNQLNYIEPYLEPRVSKKWVLAMEYVKKIIETIDLNNIMNESSINKSSIQLSSIILNICLPPKIVNGAIAASLDNENMVCRYEGLLLLRSMLTKIVQAMEITKRYEYNVELLRKNLKNHIIQCVPDPDTLLKIWNTINVSEKEMTTTDITVPTKLQLFDSVVELFLIYREIGMDITFVDARYDPADLVNDLIKLENENENDVVVLKVKVIKFLLSVDPTIFEPTNSIFEDTITLLVSQNNTNDTLSLLLSKFFEEYSEEIKVWIESFSHIKDSDEKNEIAKWFAKVIKCTVKNIEKYTKIVFAAEEFDEQRICSTQILEDLFEDLIYDTPFLKHSKQLKFSTISPFLCCAIEKIKKKPKLKFLKFFDVLLNDILYIQPSPNVLLNVIYDFKELPSLNYFQSWSSKNNLNTESILNSANSSLIQNLLDNKEMDTKSLKKEMTNYEIICTCRTVIYCLIQLTQHGILNETINNNCKKMIVHLIEVSKNDDHCLEECCKLIFNNPTILKSFKLSHKKKQKCEKMLTNALSEITKSLTIKIGNKVLDMDYIEPYKNKLGQQLRSIMEKENLKSKSIMFELISIFGLNITDAMDLLSKAMTCNLDFLVKENEAKLSDLGQLIPQLVRICLLNNCKINILEEETVMKTFLKNYSSLKAKQIEDLQEWESCILDYFKKFANHISLYVNDEFFESLFLDNISSTAVQLASFLISKNTTLVSKFIKIALNNLNVMKQVKVIFPIVSLNINCNWGSKFLKKVYNIYQTKITKYLIHPSKNVYWIPENKDAVMKIIETNYEPKICTEICRTILQNGDKINVLNIEYLQLLDVLFSKNVDEICSTHNFLLVLIFIMVNVLKKEVNNSEKLNFICDLMRKTVANFKLKESYFEELSKSHSWPQFTRFSLKSGLKISKGKEPNRLIKVLSEVCDIAYLDNGVEEYVKTMFEMTTSHSEFFNIMLKNSDLKRDLLDLLWTLIRKNNSVMLSSQIPLYLAAYNATLNESDQLILMILNYYEKQKKLNNEYKPFLFGEAAAIHYSVRDDTSTALWRQPTSTQFFDLFIPELVNNTVQNFPVDRKLQVMQGTTFLLNAELYDPAFYLPLFYSLLSEQNYVPYKKFIRSGALALSLVALTSTNNQIRLLAYNVLQRFYYIHLIAARSKHDVLLWIQFLQALGNGIQSVTENELKDIRLNGFVAVFMARVSLISNKHTLYPSLHAFFRAKPALNLNEIPEFLNFLHSSEVEHTKHRHFILEVIRDGMKTDSDAKVALRSPAFKLLYNFYYCTLADKMSQILILEIFNKATTLPTTCRLLVNNFGFLPWLNECVLKIDHKNQKATDLVENITSNILSVFKSVKTKPHVPDISCSIASKLKKNA